MTTTDLQVQKSSSAQVRGRRLYWVATGLLCLIFVYSGVWSFVDPEGTRIETVRLGFPGYVVYPLAIAKLLGVAVILWGRSRTLTGFAFAGFLYDLILALSAHIALRESYGWVDVFALLAWTGAYLADRQRFGFASTR